MAAIVLSDQSAVADVVDWQRGRLGEHVAKPNFRYTMVPHNMTAVMMAMKLAASTLLLPMKPSEDVIVPIDGVTFTLAPDIPPPGVMMKPAVKLTSGAVPPEAFLVMGTLVMKTMARVPSLGDRAEGHEQDDRCCDS